MRPGDAGDAGPGPSLKGELDELSILRSALAHEANRYRTLVELAPVGFLTTDEFGKVLDANAAASAYLEVDSRFLIGKPLLNHVVSEDRRRMRVWMLDLQRRGAPGSLAVRMVRRSGVTFDANVRATPSSEEIWWAIVDVTAERQAEESAWVLNREIDMRVATQASELQAVYDELPVGIAIIDAATRRVRGKNRRAREILRHWGGELPGLEHDDADGHASPGGWRVDRALEGQLVSREVNRLRTPDGTDILLEVSATPLRDQTGRIVAAALTFDDLSDRRRRERADAEFVENAAHQLRTPVAAIGIAAAALEAGAKHDEVERERFIGHIVRESDRMARVIEGLLGLAHIQRRGDSPLVAVVPLAPLVDEIVAGTEVRRGVEVSVDCPADVAFVGEGPMVREAIANVVRNAAAQTTHGSIRITCSRNGKHTILDVADSGPGIPAEARERIFERFFQAAQGTRGSAGLGLAIAAEAVQANHGTLELVDSPEGATFRFTLPGARLR